LHSNQDIPLLSYKGLKSNITGVGFRNDGNWMFTCAEDGFARVWDLRCKTKIFKAISNYLWCADWHSTKNC